MTWEVLGDSVRGSAHVETRAPNQDAILWQRDDSCGAIALAVSDGHGSAECFRSGTGARFAVEIAVEHLLAIARKACDGVPAFGEPEKRALAQAITEQWRRRVLDDFQKHPVTQEELTAAGAAGPPNGDWSAVDARLLAYGATLVAILLARRYALYAQIGDGDILTTSDQGATQRIFARTHDGPLNETESLCQRDAWEAFQCAIAVFADGPPAMFLATTDGYVNSFASDQDFLQVGRDLQAMVAQHGVDAVRGELPRFLSETSAAGSRDDTTVGLIVRAGRETARPRAVSREARPASRPRGARRGSKLLLALLACLAAAAAITAYRSWLADSQPDTAGTAAPVPPQNVSPSPTSSTAAPNGRPPRASEEGV